MEQQEFLLVDLLLAMTDDLVQEASDISIASYPVDLVVRECSVHHGFYLRCRELACDGSQSPKRAPRAGKGRTFLKIAHGQGSFKISSELDVWEH